MERLEIAVIGAGAAARLFVESAREVETVVVGGAYAPREAKLRAFAVEHGIRPYRGLEAVAADPRVDAVYVATPNSTHRDIAVAMLSAGKHVLVEKPLGLSATQVHDVIEAATRSGRLAMEAYRSPFEPNIAALRLACSRLPQVRRAVLIMDRYSSRFDDYRSGRVLPAFDPAFGGGSIMDLGFYPVALAVHLFGVPRSVTATGIVLQSGADAQGTILLGYDGFEAACLHSKVAALGIECQVAGEHAVVTFDECAAPRRVSLHNRPGVPTSSAEVRESEVVTDLSRPRSGGLLSGEIREFARLALAGMRQSQVHPVSDSLAVARILEEARHQVGVVFPALGGAPGPQPGSPPGARPRPAC